MLFRYTPVPDAILQHAAMSQKSFNSLDARQQIMGGFMTPYGGAMSVTPGTMTPGFATSTRIDLNQIGEARNSMLGIKLDQASKGGVVGLGELKPFWHRLLNETFR